VGGILIQRDMNIAMERDFEFTRSDFESVRALIYQHAGNTLGDSKRQLVYSRLSRRLRALDLQRFSEYIALLVPGCEEWESFTNALTTNLTAFFREHYHFPLLKNHVRSIARRPLHIWSAAASTGEEPYSIAISVAEAFGTLTPPVRILASDLDTQVLETARAGIYPLERLEKLPLEQKKAFFRKGSNDQAGYAKVKSELQNLIHFRQLNLLDPSWHIDHKFDAIFCRNVMIYFDKPTQRKLIERFLQFLQPEGLFFAGHSESFFHATDLIAPIGKTVYRSAKQQTRIGARDGAL